VQVTKTGFAFVFNRLTGEALFPIEERPVPRSPVAGEDSWPTQPHPVAPPPFARQSMTREDITNVTPESRAECLEMIKDAVVEGPLFRPIQEKLTVMFPGTNGGPNWGGASFDPETYTLYVNSMDVGALTQMVETGGNPAWRSRGTKWGRFWDSNQYPCQKPPWGHLTAIDLNSGTFRWRTVLGEYDQLTARGVPKTGASNLGGSIVTRGGLVFIAATNDSRFRAFDKDSGEQLWEYRLPASGHATPMTYRGEDGRQYVAIAAGGGNKYNKSYLARLLVFALPSREAVQ
jgi:quinoprotein glucose dehydrogenase